MSLIFKFVEKSKQEIIVNKYGWIKCAARVLKSGPENFDCPN